MPLRRLGGEHELGEVGRRQPTVMSRLFGFQEAAVDMLPQGPEVAQVVQPPADTEVVGVDHGTGKASIALRFADKEARGRHFAATAKGVMITFRYHVRERPDARPVRREVEVPLPVVREWGYEPLKGVINRIPQADRLPD